MMNCKIRDLSREARVLSGIRKVVVDNKPNMSSHYRSVAERSKENLGSLTRGKTIN